jgi:hypothetical protein
MFLPHRQAGQPALRLPGLPAYAAKTPSKVRPGSGSAMLTALSGSALLTILSVVEGPVEGQNPRELWFNCQTIRPQSPTMSRLRDTAPNWTWT